MNIASEPYSTALLMTRSMSYSRYFSTAMVIAASRHETATPGSTLTTAELVRLDAVKVTAASTAAAANHFSCIRSSPDDRANRTTAAATLIAVATVRSRSAGACPAGAASARWVSGCDQNRVASTISTTAVSAATPAANQAAGSHRRERSRPVGKIKNTNGSRAPGSTHIHFASQALARPAGQDPAATSRACRA